jgi:hypothetical protein
LAHFQIKCWPYSIRSAMRRCGRTLSGTKRIYHYASRERFRVYQRDSIVAV